MIHSYGLSHLALAVRDPNRSIAFSRGITGAARAVVDPKPRRPKRTARTTLERR